MNSERTDFGPFFDDLRKAVARPARCQRGDFEMLFRGSE